MKKEIIQMVQDTDDIVKLDLIQTIMRHPFDIELFEIIIRLLQQS